jgi:hypothetical protein
MITNAKMYQREKKQDPGKKNKISALLGMTSIEVPRLRGTKAPFAWGDCFDTEQVLCLQAIISKEKEMTNPS